MLSFGIRDYIEIINTVFYPDHTNDIFVFTLKANFGILLCNAISTEIQQR